MFAAPFCFIVLFNYRILVLRDLRKCAISDLRLALHRAHGAGNLGEAHLADVSGGDAQCVQGVARVEIHDAAEILVGEVDSGIDAAASQEHISDAIDQERPIPHLQVQIIQFLQKAAVLIPMQLLQIVRHVVLHGVFRCREQRRRKRQLVFQLSKAVFQRIRDCTFIFPAHLPNRDAAGKASGMRVGDVKVVFQADSAGRVRVKNGDACRSAIDPAPKLAIPFFEFQHGGGVRALGKKQKLIIETESIIMTSSS
ncbi:MAG: hypothetical protein IJQ02_14235 [Oscillospiraceae bacterium]|nr:hypothetical protein [Oscillospiraceae bacterium]